MAINKVTPNTLNAVSVLLSRLFHDIYKASLDQSSNWITPHMAVQDTKKAAIDFIWYGAVDEPEEVEDLQDFEYTDLLGYQFELGTREFQNAVRIPKKDFIDDDLGILNQQVQSVGATYANLWRFLAIEILNNGATAAVQTYDAVPLYDNAHIVGAGTFDNLLAGTGTFKTDIQTAYTTMQLFVNDKNQVRLDNTPTHVVVHPSQIFDVREVLVNSRDNRDNKNTENVTQGLVQSIVEPRLTDVNDFFVFRSTPTEKPFIGITNREASATNETLVSTNKVNSNSQITDKILNWAINQFKALHPTHPHLHAKTVNP
jgi:phage major head subunit gpT-like protein